MRIIILILLALMLAYFIVMPLLRRDKPSRILCGILIILLGVNGFFEWRWQVNESVGTSVVKSVSGVEEGTLHCQRLSEGFFDPSVAKKGEVFYAKSTVAIIKHNPCQDLFSWLESDKKHATDEQILSLGVLVHESVHVSGEYNEAKTECLTMKQLAAVTESLGASPEEAKRISKVYREEIHILTPPSYQGATC